MKKLINFFRMFYKLNIIFFIYNKMGNKNSGRYPKMDSKKVICISLEEEELNVINDFCKKEKIDRSSFFRNMAIGKIKKYTTRSNQIHQDQL